MFKWTLGKANSTHREWWRPKKRKKKLCKIIFAKVLDALLLDAFREFCCSIEHIWMNVDIYFSLTYVKQSILQRIDDVIVNCNSFVSLHWQQAVRKKAEIAVISMYWKRIYKWVHETDASVRIKSWHNEHFVVSFWWWNKFQTEIILSIV